MPNSDHCRPPGSERFSRLPSNRPPSLWKNQYGAPVVGGPERALGCAYWAGGKVPAPGVAQLENETCYLVQLFKIGKAAMTGVRPEMGEHRELRSR
jgi:hypothetical protein